MAVGGRRILDGELLKKSVDMGGVDCSLLELQF